MLPYFPATATRSTRSSTPSSLNSEPRVNAPPTPSDDSEKESASTDNGSETITAKESIQASTREIASPPLANNASPVDSEGDDKSQKSGDKPRPPPKNNAQHKAPPRPRVYEPTGKFGKKQPAKPAGGTGKPAANLLKVTVEYFNGTILKVHKNKTDGGIMSFSFYL